MGDTPGVCRAASRLRPTYRPTRRQTIATDSPNRRSRACATARSYCVLRTTDGNGVGPMYRTRSRDGGRTWSKPAVIAKNGVMPRLLRLGNGMLVLSSGRPGVQLRISKSGLGDDWSEPVDVLPPTSDKLDVDSCGYTGLVALDRDTFLIVYSWFQKPDADGRPRKAVLSRRIRLTARFRHPNRAEIVTVIRRTLISAAPATKATCTHSQRPVPRQRRICSRSFKLIRVEGGHC